MALCAHQNPPLPLRRSAWRLPVRLTPCCDMCAIQEAAQRQRASEREQLEMELEVCGPSVCASLRLAWLGEHCSKSM